MTAKPPVLLPQQTSKSETTADSETCIPQPIGDDAAPANDSVAVQPATRVILSYLLLPSSFTAADIVLAATVLDSKRATASALHPRCSYALAGESILDVAMQR